MIDAPLANRLYNLLVSQDTSQSYSTELKPTISKVTNYTYHAYKPLGVSFCFVGNDEKLVLDAIDVYNGKTRDGFVAFHSPDDLPCGLTPTMQAHEIVSMLGEPDRKGGGGQTRLPCWIEYKFDTQRDSGILIQLHGFEWEDREMGWTSFVLY
ncbi:hypothetical protein EDC96DRAFT_496254 [Choanephora cucurbitarum]|nr:hypothetical protein EDC96DRAFT_496254 [Choanephora cucurbitarum]